MPLTFQATPIGPTPLGPPLGMAPPEMRLIDMGDGESPPTDDTDTGENDGSLMGLVVGGLVIGVAALIMLGTVKGVR